MLVHAGVLDERDEHLESLAPWVEQLLTDKPAHHIHVLHPYASWSVLRRARNRAPHGRSTASVRKYAGSASP